MNDVNMYQITQTIRQKEKELQEIHEVRCNQLETMIIERDHLLIESTKHFEKLKDDFQYNLTLLEARDVEIERLERLIDGKEELIHQLQNDLQTITIKYDLLERKFDETSHKHNEDKVKSKQVLQELRDVVESMQWAASEESKAKLKEIESLKSENKRLTMIREEALESQRKDITTAFELLLKQRDEVFSSKESEINEQISILGNRLEQISTDNSSLKSQLNLAHRKIEELTIESSTKDDTIRKLQWKLEDERTAKQESDEVLHRTLQQTAFELSTLRVTLNTESQESKKALETIDKELSSERMTRESVERNFETSKKQWWEEKVELESKVEDLLSALQSKQDEYAILKDKYEHLLESHMKCKTNLEKSNNEIKTFQLEIEELQKQVSALKDKDHDHSELVTSLKLSNLQSLRTLEQEHDRVRKSLENHYITQVRELQSEMELKIMEYNIKTTSLESDLTSNLRLLEERTKALDDEKAEGAALRLRLQLLENQMLSLRQKHDQDISKGFHYDGFRQQHRESNHEDHVNLSNYPHRLLSTSGFHSPAFSEDMGSVSLSGVSPHAFDINDGVVYERYDNNQLHQDKNGHGHDNDNIHDDSSDIHHVVQENESLKRIIKEMRSDIETLRMTSPMKGTHRIDETHSDILEKRLEQMTDEVNRLRNERRKLLDNSNELRAALNMQTAMTYESNRPLSSSSYGGDNAATSATVSTPSPPFSSSSSSSPDSDSKKFQRIPIARVHDDAPHTTNKSTLIVEGIAAAGTGGVAGTSNSTIHESRSAEKASHKISYYKKPPNAITSTLTSQSVIQGPSRSQQSATRRKVSNYNILKELQDQ